MPTSEPFEVVDPEGLTDADWAEINKLKRAYESGGSEALSRALEELSKDLIRYMTVVAALYPDMVREQIRDEMAEADVTEEDLREKLEKLQSPSCTRH